MLPSPPLLVVTDRRSCRGDLIETVIASFRGGTRWAMLREKDLPSRELLALAKRLAAAARPFGASVLINGDAEVAVESGAAGVHLPQGRSLADARRIVGTSALIGVSAHSLDEARAAERDGADYATLSPVFLTGSKPGYGPALGLESLQAAAAAVKLPLLALGGVNAANARACIAAGAAGVAVMGGLMRAVDPEQASAALVAALGAKAPA